MSKQIRPIAKFKKDYPDVFNGIMTLYRETCGESKRDHENTFYWAYSAIFSGIKPYEPEKPEPWNYFYLNANYKKHNITLITELGRLLLTGWYYDIEDETKEIFRYVYNSYQSKREQLNEFDFTDAVKHIRENIGYYHHNPDAWVHFNWPRPNNIFPTWKTACHRKVVLKDGSEGYIGAGMYGYISEKEFIKISVKKACGLMTAEGDSALEYIQSPQSPFVFFDCFIFVYDFNGTSIIDPSYKKNSKSNLLLFKDVTNHFPFRSIAEQLKTTDETWNMLQFTSPESMNIRKKVIYCRKAKFRNKNVIVGSMIDAPQSTWFK